MGDCMSMGYGGGCVKYGENADFVLYEYYAVDLNDEKYYNKDRVMDGLIKIDKTSFVEPEIHQRIKRRPSGRKILVTKRIERAVPYDEYLKTGRIELVNSSFCSMLSENGYGRIGLRLIWEIYRYYQINGEVPHKLSFMC